MIEGASYLRSVHFSVEATQSIVLSLSQTDPITSSNYEINLGGWGGDRSVIRSAHLGGELVAVDHSVAQFNQVNSVILYLHTLTRF